MISNKSENNNQKNHERITQLFMFIFFFAFFSLLFLYFKHTNFLTNIKSFDYILFGLVAASVTLFLPLVRKIMKKIIERELGE